MASLKDPAAGSFKLVLVGLERQAQSDVECKDARQDEIIDRAIDGKIVTEFDTGRSLNITDGAGSDQKTAA